MKVTIKDIAEMAGVSLSTVSRALNDSSLVKQGTKDKIKEIAKNTKFEFNAGARSLSSRKTGNIAVVYEIHQGQLGPSLYINQLFIELRHALEKIDLDTIVLEGYHPDTGASNIDRLLRQQKVDGIIIVHDHITIKDYESMIDEQIPFVQLQLLPRYIERERIDYFFADNTSGGYIATEHLIAQGCKKILTILPPEVDYVEFANRTTGYKQALKKHNLEFKEQFIIPAKFSFSVGHDLFDSSLELIKSADGIFFQTDIQAFGFLTIAKERGIRVPEDLKIIGFDDSPICEAITPHLSTIRQPKVKLAQLACNRIMDLINKKSNDHLVQEIVSPALVVRSSSTYKDNLVIINEYDFGKTSLGVPVKKITISNGRDIEFSVINRGAALVSFKISDKDGNLDECTLGLETLKEYEDHGSFYGATIGRVGNRIGGAEFTLDGHKYDLEKNDNGHNCLHGGVKGFDKVLWDYETFSENGSAGVKFHYISRDGEENFPGNLKVTVIFSLNVDNEFTIDYRAETDKRTPVNLTNHAYWNLSGFKENIHSHILQIDAETYLPTDEFQIPTGEFKDVESTDFDFRKPTVLASPLKRSGGFDHNFNLSVKKQLEPVNKVFIEHPESGRSMEIKTTEPGVQFYTGFDNHDFFCLETQMFPDAINNDKFDSIVLNPGEVYRQTTIHKFKIKK